VRQTPDLPQDRRRTYVDNFIAGAEAREGKSMAIYRTVVEKLLELGDNDLAIQYADKALNDRAVPASVHNAYLWRAKAIAHARRHEADQTAECYRQALEIGPGSGADKEQFRRELDAVLERTRGGENLEKMHEK
jgi:tetratricopeptide (TPR) repeat protein